MHADEDGRPTTTTTTKSPRPSWERAMVRVSGRPRGAGILIKNTPSSNQNRAKHTFRTPLSSNSPSPWTPS